jgi:RNA polymerase sigma-70 factor (ECF subfamily)
MTTSRHPDHESAALDREAMERLAAGEDLALNGIMERWKNRLVAYLYRFTGNEAAALDLAQETFVRLYQGRLKFREGSPFPGWIFGIAANLARNHLRWRQRHPTLPMEEAEEGASVSEGDPSLSAEASEREKAVREAIAALPPDLREALVLAEYEHLSHAEIATIAGCSAKAVERRVSRAREILRKGLTLYLQG